MPLSVNYNLFFLLLTLIGFTAYFIVPILVIEQESPVFADTVYISMSFIKIKYAEHACFASMEKVWCNRSKCWLITAFSVAHPYTTITSKAFSLRIQINACCSVAFWWVPELWNDSFYHHQSTRLKLWSIPHTPGLVFF